MASGSVVELIGFVIPYGLDCAISAFEALPMVIMDDHMKLPKYLIKPSLSVEQVSYRITRHP